MASIQLTNPWSKLVNDSPTTSTTFSVPAGGNQRLILLRITDRLRNGVGSATWTVGGTSQTMTRRSEHITGGQYSVTAWELDAPTQGAGTLLVDIGANTSDGRYVAIVCDGVAGATDVVIDVKVPLTATYTSAATVGAGALAIMGIAAEFPSVATPGSGTVVLDENVVMHSSGSGKATVSYRVGGQPGLTWTGTSPQGSIMTLVMTAAAGDTTPPTLSTPSGTATGQTTASGSVSTNEAGGTLYRLASTSSTATVAAVKAGQSQAVTATGAQAVTFTGLTAGTTYYAHYVHTDAAGNDSTVATSASFTTTAAPASVTLTSSPLKNNTGTLLAAVSFEAYVNHPTTGALVVKKTGLTSNGSGVVSFTDAALTASTAYSVRWKRTDTGAEGLETLTAV